MQTLGASNGFAAALAYGAPIGPAANFIAPGLLASHSQTSNSSTGFFSSHKEGNFVRGSQFLGIEFNQGGADHFGWARVGILTTKNGVGSRGSEVTGFAYETNPNQGIAAGQTTEATPEPATVGLLAVGGAGIAVWRRKKAA